MYVGILDDDKLYREKIAGIVSASFKDVLVYEYSNVSALLKSKNSIDILLLDIEMPQMDGITFANTFCGRFMNVIFVTSHDELVYDCFLPNVIGFVSKQSLSDGLIRQIKKFQNRIVHFIDLQLMDCDVQVDESIILYFYTKDSLCYVVTAKGDFLLKARSLHELPMKSTKFYQISRQCIVNLLHIHHFHIAEHIVVLSNKQTLDVSRRRWNGLFEAYIKEVSL